MTRDQAERVIERLADKNSLHYRSSELIQHTDGSVSHTKFDITKPCYNPIMLTDVLEKLIKVRYDRLKLVRLWEDCGFTKSLQDIMLDGQFDAPRGKTVPSAPHELFEYLLQLFPERVSTECTHPTKSPAKKDAGEGETNYFICTTCKKPC